MIREKDAALATSSTRGFWSSSLHPRSLDPQTQPPGALWEMGPVSQALSAPLDFLTYNTWGVCVQRR